MDRITFATDIRNDSIQVGDTLYVNTIQAVIGAPGEVGPIVEIGPNFIIVDTIPGFPLNNFISPVTGISNGFFMFRKDNRANVSTLLGYFAEVHLELPSDGPIANINNMGINPALMRNELFSLSSEIFVSSK